jgi:hypothetical protein
VENKNIIEEILANQINLLRINYILLNQLKINYEILSGNNNKMI